MDIEKEERHRIKTNIQEAYVGYSNAMIPELGSVYRRAFYAGSGEIASKMNFVLLEGSHFNFVQLTRYLLFRLFS